MDDQTTTARRGPFDSGPIARESGPIAASERDPFHDNQPPFEERIVMDFMDDLARPGELGQLSIGARIAELMASAARAPAEIKDQDIAGQPRSAEQICGMLGDLCKQGREVAQRLEGARDKHNRPLLNAQRALKGRADGLIAPLNDAIAKIRQGLDDHARAEAARIAEAERKANEARRIAEEAARRALEAEGISDAIPAHQPIIAPPPALAPAPMGRGDYGARVGTQKVWCHEIESVRQLPDRLLKHPKIIEALDKLIAAEIRAASGKINIKGVRIWQDTKAAVR